MVPLMGPAATGVGVFDWATSFIETYGLAAIGLLMFVENLFPPIPSELVMPLAGFTAARGDMSLALAVVAGAIGSLLGAAFWYWAGATLGATRLKRFANRHGRWLTLAPEDIDAACVWFRRHGRLAVLVGRLVPGVRTLISVPAGISGMPFLPFLAWSAIGTAIWTTGLAAAGWLLESRYHAVADWTGPVSNIVVGVLLLWYLYRVVTFRRRTAPATRPDS